MAIIDQKNTSSSSRVEIEEFHLTDRSPVYCVNIRQSGHVVSIDCINLDSANALFTFLSNESDYQIN